MVQSQTKKKNALHDLGYKIFLDRYALKDMKRETLTVGDLVIVVVNSATGQREVGRITAMQLPQVTIELLDGEVVVRDIEHVDKPLETDPAQMMDRVAAGIAAVEKTTKKRREWTDKFRWLLEDWKFVPGGRILTAAGTDQELTFYNCYVIPLVGDSRGGIIETLGNMTEIMSRGGGVGINLSTLRPRHAYVKGVNGRSSGSVSWGALYSFVTGLIEQGGSRRGALMLILNDWHPDIFDFVNSKREAGKITNANISVGLSDRFMDAMKADADWHLQFPDTSHPDYDTLWDGDLEKWIEAGREVITYKTIKAKDLWNAIIESAWASAEPGVWFRERSNKMSNSWYFNPLIATNPCGEQPLSAYSVCNLGAINLAIFYDEQNHDVAWDDLERTVSYATRFLDNVIDTTPYFFEENRKVQLAERRVGLGTMGVAELMIKLHIRYGSDESVEFIDKLYKFMAVHAYKTSSIIAKEKGAFPQFDPEKFLQSGFMADMPDDVREQIRKDGIRNVTLLTQAPTGCVAPDTLVSTSTGLQPIVNLGDPNGIKWQSLNLAVHTDVGLREATQFYVNGSQPVKKITTNRGFTITAT
ncbi:MAG: adenosylcobalamin-dependent ribonucleoside-diphosphate reductase, partial [Anaerolineae bacterium]|nr:adenosylcobalamin-dependent ribonucleoside-diphosphate reductase [Anaerolineae bacterium]